MKRNIKWKTNEWDGKESEKEKKERGKGRSDTSRYQREQKRERKVVKIWELFEGVRKVIHQ